MNERVYDHKEHGPCYTWKFLTDEIGIPENTLKSASNRGSKTKQVIKHPEDGRKRLVKHFPLNHIIKEKIEKVIGNVEEYISKQPIRDLVEIDYNAENFYRKTLMDRSVDRVNEFTEKYTREASWLNMLIKMQADKRLLKQLLNINFKELLNRTGEIIKSEKIPLPADQRNLEAKVKAYKEQGWECLISRKFGNKHAAKIGK